MISRGTVAGARILALAAFVILLFMGNAIVAPQPAFAQAKPATFSSGAPGPEVCAGCHEDQVKALMGTKHGTKADRRSPMGSAGCATCHAGDFAAHVKAGGGKGVGGMVSPASKSIAAEDKNTVCLSCHQGDPQRIHWKDSVHAGRDLACTSCHKLHTAHDKVREKLTQPQVCFACHKEQRVQINKPSRHPVLEGKVVCADCHNVHGNNPKQMIKASVVETCYQCHMEKRGPFVHNHQPVTEDCTICHQPHGSTIANLLKSRPPFLCQQCHEPTSHRGTIPGNVTGTGTALNRAVVLARGCLNCHTNIHGTNNPVNAAGERTFRR